jgi:hypothetical protein
VVTLTFAAVEDGATDETALVDEAMLRLDVVEMRVDVTTPLQVPNDD